MAVSGILTPAAVKGTLDYEMKTAILAVTLAMAGCGDNVAPGPEPPTQSAIQQACVTYFRYGQQMQVCGPVCSQHSDCASTCCYPLESGGGGACIDVMFCDHARANGHSI